MFGYFRDMMTVVSELLSDINFERMVRWRRSFAVFLLFVVIMQSCIYSLPSQARTIIFSAYRCLSCRSSPRYVRSTTQFNSTQIHSREKDGNQSYDASVSFHMCSTNKVI